MPATLHTPGTLMARKLESHFALTDEETLALHDLPVQVMTPRVGQDIVRVGERPLRSCLILEGFACVYKLTSEGQRQIMALHVPGDIPDLQSLHLETMDFSLAPINRCTVGLIPHDELRRVCERFPRLTAAFWRETLVDASVYREWLLNVGQREAYPRVAHLLCEILVRLDAVGLIEDNTFDLPITQSELADATGMSTVHMNRVIQALRGEGLIETQAKQVHILDWEKLKDAGGFDPHYLHLKREGAA